jgi:hypothetical protein
MPRKFPNDGREWFRCLTDILNDEKLTGDCSADVFRFYIRLLAMLKRTGSRDGKIALDRHALCALAGREQLRHALRVARAGAVRELYALSAQPVHTLITVPNWPEIQGFGNGSRVEKSRVEKKHLPVPPPKASAKPARASKRRKTPCPEALTAEQWARIHAWRDTKHPDFTNRELEAQWTLHYQYHGAKGNLALDWVLSFYNWLTGPFYKKATASGNAAQAVKLYEPPDDLGPPLPEGGQALADILTDFASWRKEDMPKKKLGYTPPKPPH